MAGIQTTVRTRRQLSIGERVWWPTRRQFSAPKETGADSVSPTAGGA